MERNWVTKRRYSPQYYWEYEYRLLNSYIIPIMERWGMNFEGKHLIDIGCGLGGSTIAFAERGASCSGIDIDPRRVRDATKIAQEKGWGDIKFSVKDICEDFSGQKFDIVILRDVLEHTADRVKTLGNISHLMEKDALLFISFPPYYSPYGGHQHHPRSITKFLPYIHLILPRSIFMRILPQEEEYLEEIEGLNRITISSLEREINIAGFEIVVKEFYLLRPSFKFRYNLPIVKLPSPIGKLPGLRELITTAAFYLLRRI